MVDADRQNRGTWRNMGAKQVFNDEQYETLIAAARRALADKKRFRNQEELALALKLTQPSLSAMLRGKWKPGVSTAKAIANLEGMTLEGLIGPWAEEDSRPPPRPPSDSHAIGPAGLQKCIDFYSGSKHWSQWTIAAARAGFFGSSDFAPPQWETKLDYLEKVLEKARKGIA